MSVMQKLKAISAQMAEEAAKGDEADLARLAKLAGDQAEVLASDDARGYEGTDQMAKDVAQLRADLDEAIGQLREFRRAGLATRGTQVLRPAGREARIQMLEDSRAFLDDEAAARFGAWGIWRLASTSPKRELWQSVPTRTREICLDVLKQQGFSAELRSGEIIVTGAAKAGDIDPSVSGSGAELVSNEFKAELIRNVEAVGTIFPLCRRVPLGTLGTTTFPKRTAGLSFYWTDVAAQITRSGATFDTVDLTPKKGATLTAIPNEMFRDPGLLIAAGQFIGIESTYAVADGIDNAVVNGDGTADYGGFTGILESASIPSVAAAATHTTTSTLNGTDISNAIGGLAYGYALPNARWGMSLSVSAKLRALKASDGTPLYPRGNGRDPETIDGYPYAIGTRMPASGDVTAGSIYAVFGDFRLAYYVGMLRGIEISTSEHVYYASDMTAVRGIVHVAIAEADANAMVLAKTAAE